jgi:hypothetical protein
MREVETVNKKANKAEQERYKMKEGKYKGRKKERNPPPKTKKWWRGSDGERNGRQRKIKRAESEYRKKEIKYENAIRT